MVQTLVVQPSVTVKDYIHCFVLREFDTFGEVMIKPVHAEHEGHIAFLIKGNINSFEAFSNQTPALILNKTAPNYSGILGLQSFMRGHFTFKGHLKIFTIHFTPTGFSTIFGIPASHIIDKIYETEDVFGSSLKALHEQLQGSSTISEMIAFSEKFILNNYLLKKMSYKNDELAKAINMLIFQQNINSIKQAAYQLNMSLKTFERRFIEQVGIAPRLFERIRRFNRALNMKMSQPKLTWTNICHITGYYDQMHLIKDFTEFAGMPPSTFLKNTPPPSEDIIVL